MKSLYLLPALLSATLAPPALAGMGEPTTVPTSVDSSNIQVLHPLINRQGLSIIAAVMVAVV
jgi:hypothetical protein